MKVSNFTNDRGNKIANQFIIEGAVIKNDEILVSGKAFQSYDTMIAIVSDCTTQVFLDRNSWDYSKTTSKYRNQFLGESKKETQKKIDTGEYRLADLNR